MTERYFTQGEYENRWARTYAEMKRRGLGMMVVWGRSGGTYDRSGDVWWLTGHYGNNSGQGFDNDLQNCRAFTAVILKDGEMPEIISEEGTPHYHLLATDRTVATWDPVKVVAERANAYAAKGPVGFIGNDFFPMKHWAQLQAMTPKVAWRFEDDIVRRMRRVKSSEEIAAYREGGLIASRACNLMVEGMIAGKSEAESAGDAAREVVKSGGAIHMIPMSHGDKIGYMCRSPLPGYSLDVPKVGDIARGFVYGPMFQGYYLDPGRTVVVGNKPNPDQRELIESCATVTDQVVQALRPGMTIRELETFGNALKEKLGVEDDEMAKKYPLWGHGLGLFFEQPIFSSVMGYGDDVFEENMVVGIEVFFARPGVGSAGFEQNAIIHKDRVEILTTTPMIWW